MQTKSIRILLAEDDIDDVEIFTLALEDLPQTFDLIHAKNGRLLLERLSGPLPDFIFLDIRMAYKNGWDCIKEIRRNPLYDNVPVVVITASTSEENINLMHANNVNFYLVKPYSIRELTDKLKCIFGVPLTEINYNTAETKRIFK
jgi:CheY-like chemotaxis protein